MMKLNIQELNEYFAHRGVRETLEYFLNLDLKVGFSTSFGVEDQVITDLINDINPSTYIFSLDTGRLHEETYKTMDETIKKYNDIEFKFFYPDTAGYRDWETDRKSTRLNSSHRSLSRMPSSA